MAPKGERKRKHRNYRKEKHKEEEFSDISEEEGGSSRNKSVSKYASVASSFIEAVESATIKGLELGSSVVFYSNFHQRWYQAYI